MIKIGLVGVPPFLGAGLRFLIAATVLCVILLWRRTPWRLTRDDKIAIASAAALNFGIAYALVYWAEQYIGSGLCAILYSTMPLTVALLSRYWTGSETLGLRKIIGIMVGMAGTTILFWPSARVSLLELGAMGAALIGAIISSVSVVQVKRHARHTDTVLLNACSMLIAAVCLLAGSFAFESYTALIWTQSNVLALIYLALIGSVAAFMIYYHLLKILPATVCSMVTLIFPMIAVALGWALKGEAVTRGMLIGAATVLVGVAVTLT